jgi:hypothetical protein
MSAVSAAFLAFGADQISPWPLALVASLPLLFWFWSTYMPLDRYGNRTLRMLAEIERRLKEDLHAPLQHYTEFSKDMPPQSHGLWSQLWFLLCTRKLKFHNAV